MFTIQTRSIWLWLLLIAGLLLGCSPKSIPPGPNSIGSAVDGVNYSYHYWPEGLAILIWHDLSYGSESCSGTGSADDPVFRLECSAQAQDGRRLQWTVHTTDGVTADFWIDGQSYDLSDGTMFLVSNRDGDLQVEQLKRDFSVLEPSDAIVSGMVTGDPDVADFVARYGTVSDLPEAGTGYGLAQFEEALGLAGSSVESGGRVDQPFFSVPGQILVVGGEDIQVFEYPNAAAAGVEAAQISPDASSVGTTMMTWVATPHFYTKDRLIVLYVGQNDTVTAALAGALGGPIAQGQAAVLPVPDESPSGSEAGDQDLLAALPDALVNSQYDVLSGVIGDPFGLGFWGTNTRFLSPPDVIKELQTNLLLDASRLTFTTDRAEFPDLGDYDPEGFWGSEGQEVDLIYSRGWGPDGHGEAILVIGLNADGDQFWPAMLYSAGGFSETADQATEQPELSFEAAVYRNEANNFQFSYPAAWAYEEEVLGSRASGAQFYADGDIILSAVVFLWDPKNDLDAYIEQRKLGWSSSSTVVAEEELTLSDGNRAVLFEIQGLDGSVYRSLLAEVGENYLELSGPAELNEFEEITRTLRFLPGSE